MFDFDEYESVVLKSMTFKIESKCYQEVKKIFKGNKSTAGSLKTVFGVFRDVLRDSAMEQGSYLTQDMSIETHHEINVEQESHQVTLFERRT